MNRQEFLDPGLLAHVKNLYLAARYVAEGAIGGFHRSAYVGYNAEFSHHREYQPGDEIKHVDWKRYGKTGKYYIKQYEESSSLNALLLLDQSSSMGTEPSKGLSKEHYSKILVCALAYLLLHQRDGVGYLGFAKDVLSFLPISTRMTLFGELVKSLETTPSGGGTSLLHAVKELLPRLKKKCMILLISDFLDLEDELMEAVRMLRFHRHEVLAFHLLSFEDLQFPYQDFSTFIDVETGKSLSIEARVIQKQYQESLDSYLKETCSKLQELGVDYHLFDTSIPVEKALIHYLYKRSRHL